MQLGQILTELAIIDKWLDDYTADEYRRQPLAQDWARISKVAEELGEAVFAFTVATGQNPVYPQTDNMAVMVQELADTALAAILAMIHFTKNEAMVGAVLIDRVRITSRRMLDHKVKSSREALRNLPEAIAAQQAMLDGLYG
jgi:hypothetical protein